MRIGIVVSTTLLLIVASLFSCGGSLTDLPDGAGDSDTDSTIIPDTSVDAGPCGANEVFCGGTCFPNDVDHCGPSCAKCGAPANGTATCDGTLCGFTCEQLQCGNTCVDPTTDTKNCGACGHDCLGSQCIGSVCQPESLYPGHFANYMLGDDANLYWTDNGYLFQAPKVGGGNVQALTNGNVYLVFALDSKNLYVGIQPNAGYIPINGGSFTPLMSTTSGFSYLAIDSQFLYEGTNGVAPSVLMAPLDGGADATSLVTVPNAAQITSVFRSGSYVYISPSTGNSVGSFDRVSLDDLDAGIETLYTADAANSAVPYAAFDDAGLSAYIVAGTNVVAVPLDGGVASTLASADNILSIFLDGNELYWAEENGSTYALKRRDLVANTTTTVTGGTGGVISGVFVDSTYVYWAYESNGPGTGIYRAAK